MSVVGFRARDCDQVTNKWDGLIKDYKKIKEYIEGMGSGDWWGMSRVEKKMLSKTRKLSLEFSEAMYNEMEEFVGKRQIYSRGMDVVDTDRATPSVPRHFGRSPPTPRVPSSIGVGSPTVSSAPPHEPHSSATPSDSPAKGTPGDDTPGSTGRKRRSAGTENLVDFVKDFNYEYLERIEVQEREKRAWRSEVLAFDVAHEARIANKEVLSTNIDQKLYELEVEQTRNIGNMTSALLMIASSMQSLTRGMMSGSTEGDRGGGGGVHIGGHDGGDQGGLRGASRMAGDHGLGDGAGTSGGHAPRESGGLYGGGGSGSDSD